MLFLASFLATTETLKNTTKANRIYYDIKKTKNQV